MLVVSLLVAELPYFERRESMKKLKTVLLKSKRLQKTRLGLLILTVLGFGLLTSIATSLSVSSAVNSAQSDISLDSPASLPSDI